MQKNSRVVILSGEAASRSEASAQSRDPYGSVRSRCVGVCSGATRGVARSKSDEKRVGSFGSAQDDNAIADNSKHKRDARAHISYNELMFARNSPFDFVLLNLSISSSIASTGDSGFSTLRSTQIRVRSSFGISNSSLRVPER